MLGRLAASAAPMPWEQPSGCPCVRRGLSPPPPDGWWPGRASRALPEVRGRRRASNSCHIRPIPCTAHPPWSSIRGHRYLYARRGARRRPRPDRARPWCRCCCRRRRRRPRRRPSEPRERLPRRLLCERVDWRHVFDAAALVGSSERLRGGCRWAGPALAVTHGHAGAGAGPGGACPLLLSWSVTVCVFYHKKIDVTDVSYYTYTQLHDE
jgi:hypothetical protein